MDQHGAAVRRRNRRINTCLECQRLKRKCSRTHPCTHCLKTMRDCVFPTPTVASQSDSRADSIPSLAHQDHEAALAQQDATGFFKQANTPADTQPEQSPDICLQIGKLSITERIGGVKRGYLIALIENLLQKKGLDFDQADQYSAPIAAWIKPHQTLPLQQLMSGTHVATLETVFDIPFSDAQQQVLLDQFFAAVYPVCPLASRSEVVGNDALSNALLLAIMYAAAVSMPMLDSQKLLGVAKSSLVKSLKTMTENALCQIGILSRLELKIFQATLIYLTPQLLAEVSKSHSIFIATITRQFQIAGFDRSAQFETQAQREIKRHLWHHLLFLNIRATEAVGPERSLVDDPDAELPQLNDSVVALVRYECYKLHRIIFRERESLVQGRTSFTSLLEMADQARADIREKYLSSLDTATPLQKYACLVGQLLLARSEGMVLQTQWDHLTGSATSVELRDRSIQACLCLLEAAVALETDPDVAQWAWYSGAYQQYHSILFPLGQVYLERDLPDTERIMSMINYVFGPSSSTSNEQRSAGILRAVKDSMASFLLAMSTSVCNPDDAGWPEPLCDALLVNQFVNRSRPVFDDTESYGNPAGGLISQDAEVDIWAPWSPPHFPPHN